MNRLIKIHIEPITSVVLPNEKEEDKLNNLVSNLSMLDVTETSEASILNFYYFWRGPLCIRNKTSFKDLNGITYNCVCQYLQFKRVEYFKDTETTKDVMVEKEAIDQIYIANEIQENSCKNVSIWNRLYKQYVFEANLFKFLQNKEMAELLLSTGDDELVYTDPIDLILGIGLSEEKAAITIPQFWKGENLLGITLMDIRSILSKINWSNVNYNKENLDNM